MPLKISNFFAGIWIEIIIFIFSFYNIFFYLKHIIQNYIKSKASSLLISLLDLLSIILF